MVREDRFENSLVCGKMETRFKEKIPLLFAPGGIFSRHRKSIISQIIKWFTEAEAVVKRLYNIREHQGNSTGNRSEENKPFCSHIF